MINIKGNRILVKPDMVELKTKAGLIIAADKKVEQSAQQFGTVVSVGSDAWEDCAEPFAKVGDYILYSQYAGKVVHDPADNEGYIIMNDLDVLATVDKPETVENDITDVISALDTRRVSL